MRVKDFSHVLMFRRHMTVHAFEKPAPEPPKQGVGADVFSSGKKILAPSSASAPPTNGGIRLWSRSGANFSMWLRSLRVNLTIFDLISEETIEVKLCTPEIKLLKSSFIVVYLYNETSEVL